jgi:hypothetical protein
MWEAADVCWETVDGTGAASSASKEEFAVVCAAGHDGPSGPPDGLGGGPPDGPSCSVQMLLMQSASAQQQAAQSMASAAASLASAAAALASIAGEAAAGVAGQRAAAALPRPTVPSKAAPRRKGGAYRPF